jgi:hypothetical protein
MSDSKPNKFKRKSEQYLVSTSMCRLLFSQSLELKHGCPVLHLFLAMPLLEWTQIWISHNLTVKYIKFICILCAVWKSQASSAILLPLVDSDLSKDILATTQLILLGLFYEYECWPVFWLPSSKTTHCYCIIWLEVLSMLKKSYQ